MLSAPASSRFKRLLKRTLARLGYHLERFPLANTLEAQLLHLFAVLKINCVLDVGAHRGEYGLQLRGLGYPGRIVSFEPVAENHAVLAEIAARDGNWTARQLALGSEDGVREINVYGGSTFSSFLPPSPYGAGQFGPKLNRERTEKVLIKRLDGILDECLEGLADPRILLKLDTQGYDLVVLEGAGQRLKEVQALQTELSVQPIYEGMTTDFTAALADLRRRGFDLAGLYPVTWDKGDGLRVIEFDGLLCRPTSKP